ncbi:serine hydrolase domain-containing protein [Streptomyces syringium]|uniref:CubicO group peptidase (Beta-lactamase class C family) n=1 Tax=Streptomyces syringium TaxID=76729 RepID=A0ABS4Y7D7_9ACTN|nr:serine hydrolase domain-containing protein [Streptomyces syringium]MBP2404565.1 CubicO group peptidase (beta-lactamase class C family) [Streptomyces syringium]
MAIAVVHGDERTVLCAGTAEPGTRFETGSLTKTFTALLLAELAARGEVGYDDPLDRYLPHRLPGPPITLLHLATHTSGLPRMPLGLMRRSPIHSWFSNPYATFTSSDALAALTRTRLHHRPGTHVRYSNYGAGLLGHALAHAAGGHGSDYANLLNERVLAPLGLTDTDCDPHRPQAVGHWHGRPRPALLIPGLPAAGALRSSARDLLHYLQALLVPDTAGSPSLRAALADVQRPRLALPRTGNRHCLLWNLRPRNGRPLLHHSGTTRGFTAFAGFLPRSGTALAALANTTPAPTGSFVQAAYETLCYLEKTAPRSHHTGMC